MAPSVFLENLSVLREERWKLLTNGVLPQQQEAAAVRRDALAPPPLNIKEGHTSSSTGNGSVTDCVKHRIKGNVKGRKKKKI